MSTSFNRALFLAAIVLVIALIFVRALPGHEQKDIFFPIKLKLEFKGRTVSGALRKSEISELLNLPVRNGVVDLSEGYGVQMTVPDGEKQFMVYTCQEWKKAQADGAFAATTFDMAMDSYFLRTCGILFEFQKAKLPVKSFISSPRVTLADLDLIPAEILIVFSGDGKRMDRLRKRTLSEVVARKDIVKTDDARLELTYDDVDGAFWEAGRADFDGDGIEDMLIFAGGRAIGGTMGFSDLIILSRTTPSGPLNVIPTPKF